MPYTKKKKESFENWVNKYGDCPEKLFNMAKSDFERAVAVEFFIVERNSNVRLTKVESDIAWCKYLITGVFGVSLLTFIAINFQSILKFFGAG